MFEEARAVLSGHGLGGWVASFEELVQQHDRERLDLELPDAVCEQVVGASRATYFLGPDGRLRMVDRGEAGRKLSALEVFRSFGGSAIEEVHEFGSAQVH